MQQRYPIEGMSCASCAAKVQDRLSKLQGVEEVSVNLLNKEAQIRFDPTQVAENDFQDLVSKLGYELIIKQTPRLDQSKVQDFQIDGMSCASCAAKIEHKIQQLDPVEKSSVNLTTETLTVIWKDIPQVDAIISAVEGLGYGAQPTLSAQEQFLESQSRKEAVLAKDRQEVTKMLIFTLPIFIFTMAPMLGLPLPSFLDGHHAPLNNALFQLFLASPVLWFGRDLYFKGFKALFHGAPNMDSLGAIGTAAAYLQGLVMTLLLALGLYQPQGHLELYFETAAVILTLMKVGKYMEEIAKGKTSAAIKQLMDLTPDLARRVQDDGSLEEIPLSMVQVGDHLQVKPGERLGVDGTIVQGQTAIDESMITGESLPIEKTVGDTVTSGSLNKTGAFIYQVNKIGQETLMAQIIRLVQDAQGKKAMIAKLADTISLYFVPSVMVLALLSGLVWYFLLGSTLSFSLNIFISVLIIACPCALGLATPTAIMVGTGIGAQKGILFKNGAALELIHQADTILLDKTGTITLGQPQVTDLILAEGVKSEEILPHVAAIESVSEHPLAQAIVDYVDQAGYQDTLDVQDFLSITGKGVQARINNLTYFIGNQALMSDHNIEITSLLTQANHLAQEGKTPMYLAKENRLLGVIAVADPIKPSSHAAIQGFKDLGLKVIMVTGDNHHTANAIAKQVGIDQVYSQVLPEDKAKVVESLQASGKKVIMVGDGINDAPALALADIGMAIGSGTDIAIESADTILMHDQLSDVATAIKLSHATIRNIKQNLFWAFAYNLIGIPLAMGLIFGLFNGPLLDPMFAAFAMSLSSISVLLNALSLKLFKG